MRASMAVLCAAWLMTACADDESASDEPTTIDGGVDAVSVTDAGAAADARAEADAESDVDVESDAEVEPEPDSDAAVPDAEPPVDPIEALLAPGPHGVGFRLEEVVYTTPVDDTERRLRTAFWYPSDAEDGVPARYLGVVARPDVWVDAAPSDLSEIPLLVFSHGSGGLAEQSWFLVEYFASHGWLVAACDHPGNTYQEIGMGVPVEMFEQRPQDFSAVLDHIDAWADEHPLAELRSDDIVASGHSFGGLTTLAVAGAGYDTVAFRLGCDSGELPPEVCTYIEAAEPRYEAGFADPRVKVALPMTPAGAEIFGTGLAEVGIPVLLLTAGRDATLPNPAQGDRIWTQMADEDDLRVDLESAGHFTYSNACELPVPVGEDDGCGADFLPAAAAHRAINAYSMAFARRYLFGEHAYDELLDGSVSIEPDAILTLP